MAREEVDRVLLAGLEEHGQVAAVDHLAAEPMRAGDEVPELVVQLRGAAGEVEGGDVRVALQQPEHAVGDVPLHHLGALRAGLHVAVVAGQVAAPPDVHLEGPDLLAQERRADERPRSRGGRGAGLCGMAVDMVGFDAWERGTFAHGGPAVSWKPA